MNENAKWYLVQVVSNYEAKVKDELDNRVFADGEAGIQEIFMPMTESVTKKGNKRTKPLFPGYIFVKVEMTDESWFIIRNTQYVTGIVGSSGQRTKPTPIPQSEINKMVDKARAEQEQKDKLGALNITFDVEDLVDIKSGTFAGNFGRVSGIDKEAGTVLVTIDFMGREQEVSLPITEVKKK